MAASFVDSSGRVWHVVINVSTVNRVRTMLGLELLELAGGALLERVMEDPCTLVNVLYVVCKSQADQLTVTDEQFGESMAGDTIDSATTALLDAMVAFLPEQKRRLMVLARSKFEQSQAALMTAATARIQAFDPEKEATKALDQATAQATSAG